MRDDERLQLATTPTGWRFRVHEEGVILFNLASGSTPLSFENQICLPHPTRAGRHRGHCRKFENRSGAETKAE